MVEDLLGISVVLLNYVAESKTLTVEQRSYIVGVVRRTILVVLLELAEKTFYAKSL